jgi:hypothetical protein
MLLGLLLHCRFFLLLHCRFMKAATKKKQSRIEAERVCKLYFCLLKRTRLTNKKTSCEVCSNEIDMSNSFTTNLFYLQIS